MSLEDNRKASRARARGRPQELTALNDRHHRIVSLLVHERLNDQEVAAKLGIRPGYVHSLRSDPLFKVEFERALQAKRDAAKPSAPTEVIDQLDFGREDDGTVDPVQAAKVRMAAADRILGDTVRPSGGVNVQVGVQANVNQTAALPGYVLKYPGKTVYPPWAKNIPALPAREPSKGEPRAV
jgi:hypothetical protein